MLPSKQRLAQLQVTTRVDGRAMSVPVSVLDPPAWVEELDAGDEIVVLGAVRRRFFRAGGATASRVEIEAEVVCRARDRRRSRGLRRRVETLLERPRARERVPRRDDAGNRPPKPGARQSRPVQWRRARPMNTRGCHSDGVVPPVTHRYRESWWSTVTVEATPARGVETLDEVVIRFAGDSGDGMQLVGDRFTELSAVFGNDLATQPDFPAEIRAPAGTIAGVSAFQVHISDHDIVTPGDTPNVLVAMNPAALEGEPARHGAGLDVVDQRRHVRATQPRQGRATRRTRCTTTRSPRTASTKSR